MPLVDIHGLEGRPVEFRRKIGEIIYQTMTDTINVPQKGNLQIIKEHDKNGLVYHPEFLECVCKILLHVILRSGATKNLGFCPQID